MGKHFHRASKILRQRFLKCTSPLRRVRRQAVQRESDWSGVKSRVQAAATAKSDFLRIQLVKIVENAAYREAFVIVQRMFEYAQGNRAAVQHQILAYHTAGIIREAIRKLRVGGHE